MNEKSIFRDNAAESGSIPLFSCVCIPPKWATVTQVILTRLDLRAIFSHKVQFHLTGCVSPLMHLTVACALFSSYTVHPPSLSWSCRCLFVHSSHTLFWSPVTPTLSICAHKFFTQLPGHNLIIRSRKQKNILHSWGFHDNLQSHCGGFGNVIKIEICSVSTSRSWEFHMMSEAGWVQI